MTDIAVKLDTSGSFLDGDLDVDTKDILTDDSLETSVLISIFSDARVTQEELGSRGLDDASLRGWWGEMFPDVVTDAPFGSKAWLLVREKITRQTMLSIEKSIKDCLSWMIEDDIASSIDVSVEVLRQTEGIISVTVAITRKEGDPTLFDFVWTGQELKRGFNNVV